MSRETGAGSSVHDDDRGVHVTTFFVIGVVGLVLLAVSLLIGDVLDGALDLLDGFLGGIFSTAVIGGFTAAFGFGGAGALGAGLPMIAAIPVGLGVGVIFGWFAAWLTRLIRDGGSDATIESGDLLGHSGRVVTAIPADGLGTVRVVIGGHSVRRNARAEVPLEAGTEVHVTGVLSPTAVSVAPVWPVGPADEPPALPPQP